MKASRYILPVVMGGVVLAVVINNLHDARQKQKAIETTCRVLGATSASIYETSPVNPVTGRRTEYIEALKDGIFKHVTVNPDELDMVALLDSNSKQWQGDTTQDSFAKASEFVYKACLVQRGV